ncbi:MAG: hypothetical protein HKN17_01795, partial [Rhodothermales bacterium]|nr:hypothetical protein [Rhodothermales bacterium]
MLTLQAEAQPMQKDRQALIELYNSTDGANWINNTNWLTGEPISEWYGVTESVSPDDEWAATIDLQDNNLTGPLPSSWAALVGGGAFRDLRNLNLDGNNISGPVPPVLGQLANLQTLTLNDNNLSGGLPPEIANLQNLTFLSILGNQLTGPIPETYYFMQSLQTLQLLDNQLSGQLPSGLGQNPTLRFLQISFNDLDGTIPPDIADGASIRDVYIAYNNFSGTIPAELGGNPNLEGLDVGGNSLTGTIPPELGNLTNLTFLRLSGNQLSGVIPPELGDLPELVMLDLSSNQLIGDVPDTFKNLQSISSLLLSTNQFFSLPDLSGLNTLQTLHVFNNFFEFDDLLPNGNVTNYSYAPQYAFSGPQFVNVPAGGSATLDASPQQSVGNQYQWRQDNDPIAGATGIQYDIQNAEPADAGFYTLAVTNPALPELTLVSAEIEVAVDGGGQTVDRDALMALYNSTSGDNWTNNTNWGSAEPISEWFGITESSGTPGAVSTIRLFENNLTGPLPGEWGSMISNEGAFSSLTELSLGENQLTGNIPIELGLLDNLATLNLNDNFFLGALPAELGDLTNLVILRVDQNALTGDVPASLTTLPNLEELFVQTNFFESLPDFSATSSLRILNAQNNQFQFDDLEPNTSVPQHAFSPQQPIGPGQSLQVEEGGTLPISYEVGGSQNEYQWTLNASPIAGATSNTYEITNAQQADEGNYVLTITSPLVPGLTLITANTFVDVTGGGGTQGEYVVTNTNNTGAGSLRQAILDANANPNEQGFLDEITFNIPGAGPHVISPTSALPAITESVTIDGTTQPGATCGQSIADRDLRIIIDGTQAGGVLGGLVFSSIQNSGLVTGLNIANFSGPGILVHTSPFVSIQCSFIGVDVAGLAARPNNDGILVINSNNVLIGAGTGETGNLIAGNSGYGVRFDGQGQTGGLVIYGNLIGTDRSGSAAVPNAVGVRIENGTALIGAPDEFQSNVISGNSVRGVEVQGTASSGTFLTNNFIGTDVTGTAPVPNGEGVRVLSGASGIIVGFYTNTNDEGFSNLIAFNDGPGVFVDGQSTTGVRISANRMFSNEGLGIDLGPLGLNVNDVGDADEGPNRLMNSPQLVSSVIDGGGDLVVNYLVESDGTDAL